MQRMTLGFMGMVALVLGGLGACGGKVVIDADGTGGGGGTGNSTGTNTTTNSTGTGGGDPQSLCVVACEKLGAVPGCAEGNCVQDCQEEFVNAGACTKETVEVLQCVIDNAGVNGECFSSSCFPLLEALENCKNQNDSCIVGPCSQGSDGSCDCTSECNGQTLGTQCFAQPGTTPVCLCTINGTDVGKCESTLGTFACGVEEGCCAQFFF